jgi:hexosaminidase
MTDIPAIIPGLRQWTSPGSYLTLPDTCRLVIAATCIVELTETAKTLQELLSVETGMTLAITTGLSPAKGDIFLTLDRPDQEIGDQGYILETDEYVKVRSSTATGIFYGGQTLLQMLHQDPTHTRLPCGHARDYPDFQQRGIMLDAGRKYWGLEYLYRTMRQMARLKLNVLHLHFSDWNGFRLKSDRFPGLETSPAYSKAEITALQSYARKWHITIVPEIDLPAHATIITRYEPMLAFTCQSMSRSRWAGGEHGGWTIDYSNPAARQWMADLINEFIALFDGPYFHIGADEIPEGPCLDECPSLVAYAKEKGFPYAGDVLIDWINLMNRVVKQRGKQMQIWNWYERSPHILSPDIDIIINTWVGDGAPDQFLDAGYKIIASPENTHYITPSLGLLPDHQTLYQNWIPNTHPNMLGYKICVWADHCEDKSDGYFDTFIDIPCAILAERTWNTTIPVKPISDFIKLLSCCYSM